MNISKSLITRRIASHRQLPVATHLRTATLINNQCNRRQMAFYSSSSSRREENRVRATTVLAVRKDNKVALVADGQVSRGNCIVKGNAKKLRTLANGSVIAGFAGSTADAITLFERLEEQIEKYPKQLMRASVEMAKQWRQDKYLRKLEAVMVVADANTTLLVSGDGNVLEPEYQVLAIGSGGHYAEAAALGILSVPENNLSAMEIAKKAMGIAANICIYSNNNFTELELGKEEDKKDESV